MLVALMYIGNGGPPTVSKDIEPRVVNEAEGTWTQGDTTLFIGIPRTLDWNAPCIKEGTIIGVFDTENLEHLEIFFQIMWNVGNARGIRDATPVPPPTRRRWCDHFDGN